MLDRPCRPLRPPRAGADPHRRRNDQGARWPTPCRLAPPAAPDPRQEPPADRSRPLLARTVRATQHVELASPVGVSPMTNANRRPAPRQDYMNSYTQEVQLDRGRTILILVDMQYASGSRTDGLGRKLALAN